MQQVAFAAVMDRDWSRAAGGMCEGMLDAAKWLLSDL